MIITCAHATEEGIPFFLNLRLLTYRGKLCLSSEAKKLFFWPNRKRKPAHKPTP